MDGSAPLVLDCTSCPFYEERHGKKPCCTNARVTDAATCPSDGATVSAGGLLYCGATDSPTPSLTEDCVEVVVGGCLAAKTALADGGLAGEDGRIGDGVNAKRFGVLIGSGCGGIQAVENSCRILFEKGPKRITPFLLPSIIGNTAGAMVAIVARRHRAAGNASFSGGIDECGKRIRMFTATLTCERATRANLAACVYDGETASASDLPAGAC